MCAVEPPEISYFSKILTNAYVLFIIYGLYQKLLDENKIMSVITGHWEAIATRVERCAAVITDVMDHSANSFKHLMYGETYIKVVHSILCTIVLYYVPFCEKWIKFGFSIK